MSTKLADGKIIYNDDQIQSTNPAGGEITDTTYPRYTDDTRIPGTFVESSYESKPQEYNYNSGSHMRNFSQDGGPSNMYNEGTAADLNAGTTAMSPGGTLTADGGAIGQGARKVGPVDTDKSWSGEQQQYETLDPYAKKEDKFSQQMKIEKEKLSSSAIDDSPQAITDVSVSSSKEKRSESSGSYGDRRKSIKDSILGVFKRRGSDASPPTSPALGLTNELGEEQPFVKQPMSIYDRRHRKSNPASTEIFETRAFLADLETRRKSKSGGPSIVFDPETGKNVSTKEVISREEAKSRAMSHLPEAVQKSLLKKKSELINPWDDSQKSPTIPSDATMENNGLSNSIGQEPDKALNIMRVVTPSHAARIASQFTSVSDGERSGANYYDTRNPPSHSTGDVAFSLIGPPGDFNADSNSGGKRRSLGDLLFRRRSSAGSLSSDEGNSQIGSGFDSVTHDPAVILPRSVKAQENALEHGKVQYPGGPKAGQESGGDMSLGHLVGGANVSGTRDKATVSSLIGTEYTHNPQKPHVGTELPKVELKKLFKAKTGTHTYSAADPSFEDPAYELKAGGLTGGDSNLQNPEY